MTMTECKEKFPLMYEYLINGVEPSYVLEGMFYKKKVITITVDQKFNHKLFNIYSPTLEICESILKGDDWDYYDGSVNPYTYTDKDETITIGQDVCKHKYSEYGFYSNYFHNFVEGLVDISYLTQQERTLIYYIILTFFYRKSTELQEQKRQEACKIFCK